MCRTMTRDLCTSSNANNRHRNTIIFADLPSLMLPTW